MVIPSPAHPSLVPASEPLLDPWFDASPTASAVLEGPTANTAGPTANTAGPTANTVERLRGAATGDPRFVAVNRAFRRLYGLDAHALFDAPIEAFTGRRLPAFLYDLGRDAAAQGEPRSDRFLDPSTEPPRALRCEASPLDDAGQRVICTLRVDDPPLRAEPGPAAPAPASSSSAPTDSEDSAPAPVAAGEDTERLRSGRIHKIQSQVLESMSEGVALSTPAGFVLYTNPALDAMFGLAPGALIGQPLDRLGPSDRPDTLRRRGADLGRGGRWSGDLEQCRADGHSIVTHVELSALDIDGAIHWVVVFEDVTSKRQAEAETRRLEERLGRTQKLESLAVLAGGIAHDFNNLLMVVLGNASLAIDDLSDESLEPTPLRREALVADLRQIESAALRAAELTEQMLAYSGRGQFLLDSVDLTALVQSLRPVLEASAPPGVILDFELPPVPGRVEADAEQLRQLVLNLLTNAAEALPPEGGTVHLGVTEHDLSADELHDATVTEPLAAGRYLVLSVADDGCGMTEAVRAKIFDPFFTTKFTGRGLGLAAVQGIVRGHDGGVRVDSTPGTGTRVAVYLPVSTHELEDDSMPSNPPRSSATVLVVDDEIEVRRTTRRMLERLGLDVLEAPDGHAALALFGQQPDAIDLVLLDWSMPGLDGEATLRALREARPDVRVVVSSGWAVGDLRLGDAEPPAGYLQKPYQPTELARTVEQVIAFRAATDSVDRA